MTTHRPGVVDPAVAAQQNSQANRRLKACEYRSPSTRNRTHSWVMINAETKPRKSVAPSGKRTVRPRPILLQIPSLERVMNSTRKGLGIGETEIAREPSRP